MASLEITHAATPRSSQRRQFTDSGRFLQQSPCAYPDQLEDPAFRREFALEVQKSVEGNGRCPMAWVTERWGATNCYNTKKSAFWRVIKQVTQSLMADANCKDWSSRLVWSNLYKVSPGKGGNPGPTLCNVQLCGCKEVLVRVVSCLSTYEDSGTSGSDFLIEIVFNAVTQTFPHFCNLGAFQVGAPRDSHHDHQHRVQFQEL